MLRALALSLPIATLSFTAPVWAQNAEAQVIVPETALSETAPELQAMFSAFGLYDILQIMSVEGIESAGGMEDDMFPGRGGAAWQAVVAGIYSADRLIADFEAAVPVELFGEDDIAALDAFATSERGQRIVAGEIAARRAFLDPGTEDTANEIVAEAFANDDPRIALLSEFIEAHDLIERNVSGALNANFAFFRGLQDGNGFEVDMPEELMLAEVWGQEPEIRSNTTQWLFAYQITAYSDLSDEDLQSYIDLGATPAGQAFNTALFRAFDVMFERVSYDLGAAAAVFIAGEET